MATLIAYQSGDWTGSTTWKAIATGTGAALTTNTTAQNTGSSYVYSTAFTVTNNEVIDGLLLYGNGTTTSGTIDVALSADNGVTNARTVTVNNTDLPTTNRPAWIFFKFATPLTADGGNDYRIGIRGAVTGSATGQFYQNGTNGNWAHLLRQDVTATIASTDNVYISDELTGAGARTHIDVTMNSTSSATTYGAIEIGGGGTLLYGTSASTNYHLKLAGNINVRGDGTFNIGTVATPIPRTSTAKLEFACASNVQYGLEVLAGGTFTAQGLSRTSGKNVYYCLLNTDEAVNSTNLGVDTDTGWLDNDQIAIAATGSVLAQYEVGALNGNAGASTLTVDGFAGTGGGLAFAHSGTAPTQAEVINLTRNVQIFGASLSLCTYIYCAGSSNVDMDWAQIYWIGSGTSFKLGINADNSNAANSFAMNYCSIHDTNTTTGSRCLAVGTNADNVTFSNNVIYNAGQFGVNIAGASASTSLTFNDNVCIRSANVMFFLSDIGGTFNNNRVSGGTIGFTLQEGNVVGSFSGNIIHNCNAQAINFSTNNPSGAISSCKIWHNNISDGVNGAFSMSITTPDYIAVSDTDFYGNRSRDVLLGGGCLSTFTNCTFAGTTTLASPIGISFSTTSDVILQSCTFRATAGIYTSHSTADIAPANASGSATQIKMSNCVLGATTEVSNQSYLRSPSFISSAKHDQTAGSHRTWKQYGTITTDSTIYKTAAPSERLTPNNASGKLESGNKLVAIANGTTKTVSVWVRESVTGDGTDYNGNRIRLRYRRSDAAGVTSDGTIDTATSSSEGAWEQLTGTTPAVTDDAVLEFYVDCDGTTGWINVDDWAVT